ncbi:hypothetical protein [Rubrobacter indicoceani]|uniref:hypothetical protein n=1 Tax=Rubrobacter indicoceani TaxID=2051957 RepID=UPI000E5BD069|nr:hypothetical protein [Rubrobacter indicoceani]
MEDPACRKEKIVRNLRLAALTVALFGGLFSFVSGTWSEGFFGLAVSLGVAVFGFGERLGGEDRAVGLVLIIVGVIGAAGHLVQVFLW